MLQWYIISIEQTSSYIYGGMQVAEVRAGEGTSSLEIPHSSSSTYKKVGILASPTIL